ncbi:MAG TPA: glucose-1-phosphate thymidylyltransferase RfbA [Rhizomicrobium sp.]|nr:glucose-1-phosphate thymidylyltransferase RfbA [Rhizomicrobium sp.]
MSSRRGIILSGGRGTRLHPLTLAVSKQLMPVYDKPLVYYPLSVLMLAGIREILLITNPEDVESFRRLFGDGAQWGLSIDYAVQPSPGGIAQALIIGKDFIQDHPSALILGDNIYYGDGLGALLQATASRKTGASVFAYWVEDPERYGVVEFDAAMNPVALVEKPRAPKSNYAVTGLYFYDADAPRIAASLQPSARGELEITDLNKHYLAKGALHVERFGRGYAWLDAGTHDSLIEASLFIQTVEKRQGLKIACPEEIAFRKGYIERTQLEKLAAQHGSTDYGRYLKRLAASEII